MTAPSESAVPGSGKAHRSRRPALWRVSQLVHGAAAATCVANPALWPWALAAVGVNQLALVSAVFSPRSHWLGANLVRGPAAGAVALTFDDGPNPALTPYVLEMLAQHDARASFFCVGDRARQHPDLVRTVVAAGHSIENHSHEHPWWFAMLGPRALGRQIDRAQATLADIAGTPPTFFRAPMGFRSPLLDGALQQRGLRYASWTRRGFDTTNRSSQSVLGYLTRGLAAGDILLLHDGHSARSREGSPVIQAVLPQLLKVIRAAGLRAVSLPELAGVTMPH